MVDDASRDKSVEEIKRAIKHPDVASRFERLEVIRRTANGGAHNSINVGLRAARGCYLTIINTDDLYLPRRVESLLRALHRTGAGWAFSRCSFIDADGGDCSGRHPVARMIRTRQHNVQRFPSVGFALMSTNVVATSGNIFMSRNAYEQTGAFSPFKYCHDWDYVLRLLSVAVPVYLDEELYAYRLHGTNSYLALGDVGSSETSSVLQAHLRRAAVVHAPHLALPTSGQWPGLYELWCEWQGLVHLGRVDELTQVSD